MSRNSSNPPSNPPTGGPGGLMPLDASEPGALAPGAGPGVFRLETMAPGADGAQQGGPGGLAAPRKSKVSTQALGCRMCERPRTPARMSARTSIDRSMGEQ